MSTLGSHALDDLSPFFRWIYLALRPLAASVVGAPLSLIADRNEQYVVNVLDRPYDEQGWHLDSYDYALNAVVSAPAHGGRLQVMHANTVKSFAAEPGRLMLLETSRLAHRVEPIVTGDRVVLNMSYHTTTAKMPRASYSSDTLYAP